MRRSLIAPLGVLAAAVALLGPFARIAEARGRVAVVGMAIEGVEDGAEGRFATALEEGLRGAGWEVVPRDAARAAIASRGAPDGCTFGPCLAGVGRALGVERVIDARAVAAGPSYTFVLTLVETASGAPLSQVVDSCAVCTVEEALAQLTLSVVSLGAGVKTAGVVTQQAAEERAESRTLRGLGWGLLAAGVVGVAAGAATVAWTGHDAAGWTAAGSGAMAASTAIVLLVVSR